MTNRTLELLIILLVVLYLFGLFTPLFAGVGSLIHILLVAILIVILVRLLQGRNVLQLGEIMPPWHTNFFTGFIVDAQRRLAEAAPTAAEADFLEKELQLSAGAKVLDVPCGEGRLSRALSERGYQMTGVDSSDGLLAHAKEQSSNIDWQQRDMRELTGLGPFDAAFCFGNSFGYFDDAGNNAFLRAVAGVLKPGGRFALETHFAAENIFPQPLGRRWYPMGELIFLHDSVYDPATGILTSDYILINRGTIERKTAHYRVFLFNELAEWMRSAGFSIVTTYGSLNREAFRLGSGGLWVIGEKK